MSTTTPTDRNGAEIVNIHTARRVKLIERAAEIGDWVTHQRVQYSDAMLRADIEAGGYGIRTHPRVAEPLLRLDTVERRVRAVNEAHTLGNVVGGVPSANIRSAVDSLLALIARGAENEELYGERFARVAREQEADLRASSGDSAAIYYPTFPRQRSGR